MLQTKDCRESRERRELEARGEEDWWQYKWGFHCLFYCSVPSPSKKISRSVRSSSVQPQQQQQQQQQLSKLAPSQSLPHNLSHSNHAYTLDLGSTTPDPKKGRNVSFFDTSGAFLAESRETISRMEKEAEQLERTYREFSYPVTGITDGGLFKHSLPAHLAPGPSPLLSDLDVPYPAMYGRYGLSTLTPSPPPPMAALSSIRSSSAYTHPPVSTTMAMHASFTSPLLQQQTPSPQPATTPEQPSPPTVTQTPLLVGQPGIGTVATTTSVHLASSSSPSPSPLLLPVTSVQQSVAVQPSSDPQPLSSAARLTPSLIPSAGAVTAPETTNAAVTAPETTSAAVTAPETASAAVTAPETRLNPLLAVSSTITPASALPPTSITSSTTVYPASPLDSDAPGKVSVVVGLPTSSNEGSSSAQPKSVMSLDSWWNVSKPDNADKPLPVTTFTTQHTQEDKASSSLLVTPVVDALAPSHAYTSLTGSVHSPISSIAVSIAGGQLQKVRGTSSSGGAAAVATAAAAASENSGKKDLPTNIVPTSQPPQAGHHPAPTGGGNAGLVREEEGEKPKEEDEDDGIDPVMLKYMQLVKEKRQERQTEVFCSIILVAMSSYKEPILY